MNNITIFQDKVNFIIWRTKGSKYIPIFGKGEARWTVNNRLVKNKTSLEKVKKRIF